MPYPATRRGARAGRLPSGGPQHAARASRIAAPPGPRPASNFSQPTTQFSARSSSGAPPGARLWRSLRSEAGDSANRATRSQPRVRLTAAPLSLRRVSRARRFNCFGDKPKQLNRLLRRRRAVPSGTPKWQPLPQLDGTALRGRRPSDLGGTERYCVSLTGSLHPVLCRAP